MQQRFDFSEIQNLSDCTDPPTPRIMELVNLYENNELAKLMDQISSLLIYYPKSSILLNICGTAYSALNKFDLAIKLFEKSIDQKKNNPEAYNNLGIAYQKLEKIFRVFQKHILILVIVIVCWVNSNKQLKHTQRLLKLSQISH